MAHTIFFGKAGIAIATVSKNTAAFVRQARITLGLSQEQLGKLIGRGRRAVMRYEQGWDLPPAIDLAIQHLLSKNKQRRKRKIK
jgi:DNA-binding XRE family transcriptional regulator